MLKAWPLVIAMACVVLHVIVINYKIIFTGSNVEDTSNDSGDGLTVVVAVLSVLLVIAIICIVLLMIWNIKLNMEMAKMKKK